MALATEAKLRTDTASSIWKVCFMRAHNVLFSRAGHKPYRKLRGASRRRLEQLVMAGRAACFLWF